MKNEGDLTRREAEVLAFLRGKLSIRAIAAAMGISRRTVEWHVAGVYRKLGIGSRAEARA